MFADADTSSANTVVVLMRMLRCGWWGATNVFTCRLKNYLFQTDVRVGNLERCADWKNSANVKGAFKAAYREVSLPACLSVFCLRLEPLWFLFSLHVCVSLFWALWFC